MLNRTRIVQVISGVLLAIAGSATWDFIAKPFVLWTFEITVTIATLGISSFRDGIYLEISKDFGQITSIYILIAIYAGTAAMFLNVAMIYIRMQKPERSRLLILEENLFQKKYLILPVLIFGAVFSYYMMSRAYYISSVSSSIRRYQAIIAPYMSESERLTLQSRFRAVENRSDFIAVMDTIRGHLIKNGYKGEIGPFL